MYLILSRYPHEAVRIGGNIVVRVMNVDGRKVRLGIDAPRHVSVDREEIYERKLRQEENAKTRDENTESPAKRGCRS